MSNNVYHDHLDVCVQCREHPFGLCSSGERLLREAALGASGSEQAAAIQIAALRAALRVASPDDIRALGWSVAVHNDYRQNGKSYTFWLFTKDGRAIKGEGRSDATALMAVRKQLR